MAVINLMKNVEALISVRISVKTVLTNGKFKFDSKNNDSESNSSNSIGNNNDNKNNEQKHNYKNDNNNEDKNKSNNNDKNFLIRIIMTKSYDYD